MAKNLSVDDLARHFMQEMEFTTGVERRGGEIVFVSNELRRALQFARDKHDPSFVGWTVYVEHEPLRESMSQFGGIGLEIWRPRHNVTNGDDGYRYRRSDALTPDSMLAADLRSYARPCVWFISDSADLGRVLLNDSDVRRGDVWVSLTAGTAPARLVKAVILARVTGDSSLEAAAFERLRARAEIDISWVSGEQYLFRQAVADWARRYASAAPVDLSDLAKLKNRRLR